MTDPKNHANLIWSVADLLRGDYKQSEYGKVILPLTVIRRLDCVRSCRPLVEGPVIAGTRAQVGRAGSRRCLSAPVRGRRRFDVSRRSLLRRGRRRPCIEALSDGMESGSECLDAHL